MEYQVIIVGGGPSGIFAALTLQELGVDRIILFEKGKDISKRQRNISSDILCGWGGAGAYSDGKLTLSTEVGGHLGDYLDQKSFYQLLMNADKIFVDYGAPDRLFGDLTPEVEALADKARQADLELIPTRIRHIGTENCQNVLSRMYDTLSNQIEIRTGCGVEKLLAKNNKITGVKLESGEIIPEGSVVS